MTVGTCNAARRWRAVLALVVALQAGCATSQPRRAVSQRKFTFEGATYQYLVFTPTAFRDSAQLPLLLLLHGADGKGEDMLNLWQDFAEQKGILLVAPTFPLDAKFETQEPQPSAAAHE